MKRRKDKRKKKWIRSACDDDPKCSQKLV